MLRYSGIQFYTTLNKIWVTNGDLKGSKKEEGEIRIKFMSWNGSLIWWYCTQNLFKQLQWAHCTLFQPQKPQNLHTVKKERKCKEDFEILHGLVHDTTRTSSYFSNFRLISRTNSCSISKFSATSLLTVKGFMYSTFITKHFRPFWSLHVLKKPFFMSALLLG